MKLITYQTSCEVNFGTEELPDFQTVFHHREVICSDAVFAANYAIAQQEAYGEITVEDIPDPEAEPSPEEDTAAMLVDHEYRLTLLELGLNE